MSWCCGGQGVQSCPMGVSKPCSFVLGAASLMTARSPLCPDPLLAFHPHASVPLLSREVMILASSSTAQGFWKLPHTNGRAGPLGGANVPCQHPWLVLDQSHCCLLLFT